MNPSDLPTPVPATHVPEAEAVASRDLAMDGLRGLSALWVFGAHATYDLLPASWNLRASGRGAVLLVFCRPALLAWAQDDVPIAAFRLSAEASERFWEPRLPFAGIMLVCLSLALAAGAAGLRRALCARPLPIVGRVSFGFYLSHAAWITWATSLPLSPSTRLAVAFGASMLTAALAHVCVEAPVYRLGARVATKLHS